MNNFSWAREIQARAKAEEDVTKIMVIFPMATYNVHPSYAQFLPCVQEMATLYSLDDLYFVFASGHIPNALDAIICKYVPTWPPIGEIVDSEPPTRTVLTRQDALPEEVRQAIDAAAQFSQALHTLEHSAGHTQRDLDTLHDGMMRLASDNTE